MSFQLQGCDLQMPLGREHWVSHLPARCAVSSCSHHKGWFKLLEGTLREASSYSTTQVTRPQWLSPFCQLSECSEERARDLRRLAENPAPLPPPQAHTAGPISTYCLCPGSDLKAPHSWLCRAFSSWERRPGTDEPPFPTEPDTLLRCLSCPSILDAHLHLIFT